MSGAGLQGEADGIARLKVSAVAVFRLWAQEIPKTHQFGKNVAPSGINSFIWPLGHLGEWPVAFDEILVGLTGHTGLAICLL